MGDITPNIGIYVPDPGETLFSESFAAGMNNVDEHDHSGGPNKGVPIANAGIADFSITFNKLAPDVADANTGIGVETGANANKLQALGLLKNIFQIATVNGFISKNGSLANARTITGTSGQIAVANGDGVGGNPTLSLPANVVNTQQTAFNASCSPGTQGSVMGDGTVYTVVFATLNFQQGTAFDAGATNTTFTAPVSGVYLFNAYVEFKGISSNCITSITLHTSAPADYGVVAMNTFNIATTTAFGSNDAFIGGTQIIKLTAGQTVVVQTIANRSSAGSISVAGGFFSGVLLC